jgi:hypothetical protein
MLPRLTSVHNGINKNSSNYNYSFENLLLSFLLHVSTHIKVIVRHQFKKCVRKVLVKNRFVIKIVEMSILHNCISYICFSRNFM